MRTKDEASKIACNKIREVFAEAIQKHPLGKDFNHENDDILIGEFIDEWTWYMQGWLDSEEFFNKSIGENNLYWCKRIDVVADAKDDIEEELIDAKEEIEELVKCITKVQRGILGNTSVPSETINLVNCTLLKFTNKNSTDEH